MPGLAAHLAAAGHEIATAGAAAQFDAEVVAGAALEHRALIGADSTAAEAGARLVASLPAQPLGAAPSAAATPTHLLCGALAVALVVDFDAADHPARRGAAGFRLRCAEGRVSVTPGEAATVLLNGETLEFERPVVAGDAIACDGDEFRLIALVDG